MSIENSDVEELNRALAPANAEADVSNDEVDEEERTARVDSELEEAASDTEREAIRERRREERKTRRARQQDKRDSLTRQVESLMQTVQNQSLELNQLKNVNAGAQSAQIDQAINQAQQAHSHFKTVIADATTKGDGATVAEATVGMIRAEDRAKELRTYKANMGRGAGKQNIDPSIVNHGSEFLKANSWYGGPQSNDPDSRVMTAVDNSLAAEGWDPKTPAYWEELQTRAAKYLPHRTNGANSPALEKSVTILKSPVAGGSGGNSTGGGAKFVLSAERVKAMKDSGAWDDPKRRESMVKRFKEFDSNTGK